MSIGKLPCSLHIVLSFPTVKTCLASFEDGTANDACHHGKPCDIGYATSHLLTLVVATHNHSLACQRHRHQHVYVTKEVGSHQLHGHEPSHLVAEVGMAPVFHAIDDVAGLRAMLVPHQGDSLLQGHNSPEILCHDIVIGMFCKRRAGKHHVAGRAYHVGRHLYAAAADGTRTRTNKVCQTCEEANCHSRLYPVPGPRRGISLSPACRNHAQGHISQASSTARSRSCPLPTVPLP